MGRPRVVELFLIMGVSVDKLLGKVLLHDHVAENILSSALVDTKANILAETPTAGKIAFTTDSHEFLVYNGTNWKIVPVTLETETSSPDMGAYNEDGLGVSSKQGYGDDYLATKRISQCLIGNSDRDEEGSIRVVDGTFQIYANSVWNDVVINFRFREDSAGSYELEHKPVGFEMWYEIMSGNSDTLGIDGKPIVQQYTTSMGAFQKDLIISGGTF